MNKETSIKAASLHSAMALAFTEIEKATKSATNPHFKSKYANLEAVIDTIKPPLVAHNLFFTQHCHPSDHGISVETMLHHASGESMSLGTLYVPANKQDPQGFGSALTYARRYGLQTGFGVPTEDDDGNAAVRSAVPSSSAPIQPSKMIADADRDLIQTLAPAARKTVQGICEAYKIAALTDLTDAQAKKLIERLQSEAKAPAKETENA